MTCHLAEIYGPQCEAVVSLLRQAAALTDDEAERLAAAEAVTWKVPRGDARTLRVCAGDFVRAALRSSGRDAAASVAWDAAYAALGKSAQVSDVCGAVWDAVDGVVSWDLATPDGPYTIAHRDFLLASWREVCGLPDGLLERDMT